MNSGTGTRTEKIQTRAEIRHLFRHTKEEKFEICELHDIMSCRTRRIELILLTKKYDTLNIYLFREVKKCR